MLHVFPFSAREGTKAFYMKDQISPEIKDRRKKVLLDLSKKLWEEYVSRFINKEVSVLVERYIDGYNIGHTSNYIEVKYKDNVNKVGKIDTILLQKSMIQSR